MPGRDEAHSPVTLELSAAVVLRAGSREGPAAELALSHSRAEGPMVVVVTDRRYLTVALSFTVGFGKRREIAWTRPRPHASCSPCPPA